VYIDINLLPRELRPKKAALLFNLQALLVLLIIIAAAVMGGYCYYINKNIQAKDAEKQSLLKQQMLLKETVELQQQVDELKGKVLERVNIIKDLTANSDLRFAMLQHINSILPENLWLINIVESTSGNEISYTIEGMSYTKEDISSFLLGLEKYDKFKNVSLKSITPSPMEIRDAYQYVVDVELVTYKPPEPPKEQKLPSKKTKTAEK